MKTKKKSRGVQKKSRKNTVPRGHARTAAKSARRKAPSIDTNVVVGGKNASNTHPGAGHYQFNGQRWANYEMKQAGLQCAADCPGCNG